jgi:hypothetical protein
MHTFSTLKNLPNLQDTYVERLNIEPGSGDCILRTIHYMVNGRSLTDEEIVSAKERIVHEIRKRPRTDSIKALLLAFGNKWPIERLAMNDDDAVTSFMDTKHASWWTIIIYLNLLEVCAYVMFKGTRLSVGEVNSGSKLIYLYVDFDERNPRGIKHMYGLIPHGKDSELAVLNEHYPVMHQVWTDPSTYGKKDHILFSKTGSVPVPEVVDTDVAEMNWAEVQDWKIGMDSDVEPVKTCASENITEKAVETEDEETVGDEQTSVSSIITSETNARRDAAGQANLAIPAKGYDVDLQAHDPGEFGRLTTIYQHTNRIRAEKGQEALTSSQSKSDRDMHTVNLHEDEKQHFKTTVIDGDVHHTSVEEEKGEAAAKEKEEVETVYMAKVSACQQSKQTALFDSGATHHIWGQSLMLQRMEEGKLVLFDDGEDGWADDGEMSKCVDKNSTRPMLHTRITVASGNIVPGKVVPSVDIGVNGRTMQPDGTWEDEKRMVFLKVRNGSASSSIKQTIMAEGQLLRENKDMTLIMHGTEKYMVVGRANITFEKINGVDPVRIDLRPEGGCHYLDICTAMMEKEQVRSRFPEDREVWDSREAAKLSGKNYRDNRFINVNTAVVTEDPRDLEEITAEEIDELCQPVKGRILVPAHDSEPFDTEYEANVNRRHSSREARPEFKLDEVNYREIMCRAQHVLESRDYSEEEKMDALEELGLALDAEKAAQDRKMAELSSYKTFYRRSMATLVQVNNIQTKESVSAPRRSERNKPKLAPVQEEAVEAKEYAPSENEIGTDIEPEEGMEEYDKEYKAGMEKKRRVRFEEGLKDRMETMEGVHRKQRPRAIPRERTKLSATALPKVDEETVEEAGSRIQDVTEVPVPRKLSKKERKRSEKAKEEALRRGGIVEEQTENRPEDVVYGMYEDQKYQEHTQSGIEVMRDDKYTVENGIDQVSDYTLAMCLMENRVSL